MSLTQAEAARVYATAWNRLDASILEAFLDDDIRQTSQNVLTDLVGKNEVVDYLRQKMDTIRSSPNSRVFAELGETRSYPGYTFPPEDCVVVAQGRKENVLAIVLFEVENEKITQINLCSIVPTPGTAVRHGIYPE